MERIEKVRKIVQEAAIPEDWEYHISSVIKYSLLLGKQLNGNLEVLELAATLHDIGRQKYSSKDHEITGAKEARKILEELEYPEETIKEVESCILKHRAKEHQPETLEEQIIANADAMAHLDGIADLMFVGFNRGWSLEETLEGLKKKINRGWNEKLTLPEAKDIIRDKKEAFDTLF